MIQTRIEKPMSPTCWVYVASVAPGICTHVARSPTGLQRRQEYVNVIGSRSVPTRADRESVCVDHVVAADLWRVPDDGRERGHRPPSTSEFCAFEPSPFVAVTCTRSRLPESVAVGVKKLEVAPTMSTQCPFTGSAASQRFH